LDDYLDLRRLEGKIKEMTKAGAKIFLGGFKGSLKTFLERLIGNFNGIHLSIKSLNLG